MPLLVNLRHLSAHNLVLRGELPAGELDIDTRDEMIRFTKPVQHEIEVQKLNQALLIRGGLEVMLDCHCVRCLKPFSLRLELKKWTCHVPLAGEDSAKVVNDCVDLTPYIREDILLEFPRHPLCEPGCPGLDKTHNHRTKKKGSGQVTNVSPAWAELDKLKL